MTSLNSSSTPPAPLETTKTLGKTATNAAVQNAWAKAQRILRKREIEERFAKYRNDPVGFGRDVLGDFYTEDVINVMESVRDNPVTIARSANDVGKSHAAARICIWYYMVYNDAKVIMAAAPPLENLKMILWGEIMSIVRKNRAELFTGHRIKSLHIYRDEQLLTEDKEASFIQGVAIPTSGSPEEREAKFSGKHAPHLLFVIDEGDAVPDEVYKGIESCMSGGHNRLLIMFNPRGQVGPVYMKEKNKEANVVELSAFNHPNVIKDEDIIPGAVTRNITLRRINEWTRPTQVGEKDEGDMFKVPGFLEGQTTKALDGRTYSPLLPGKRKILKPEFSYMVLGKYPTQSIWQLINETWIERAVGRWEAYVAMNGETPPGSIQPTMGIDLAEYGTDSNVACFRYGDYVARLIPWTGLDPDHNARRSLELYLRHNAKIAMADGTGVGGNVAPFMAREGRKRDVRAVSVKSAEKPSPVIKTDEGEFYMMRDQLWWAVREWLRTEPAMIPPDGHLMEELKTVEYTFTERGRKIRVTKKDDLRKKLKRSTDRSDALCLTFSPFERPRWIRFGDQPTARQEQVQEEEIEPWAQW